MSTDPISADPALAQAAAQAPVLTRAVQLAEWVGAGKPITAKGVLRPIDARQFAKELGVDIPDRMVTTASVPAIHHPWLVAQAAGLIAVDATRAKAVAGAAITDPLPTLLAGLTDVLTNKSSDRYQQGAEILCRLVLTALVRQPRLTSNSLHQNIIAAITAIRWQDPDSASAVLKAFSATESAVADMLRLLAEFGLIDTRQRVTPLGQWVLNTLNARVPKPIMPDMSAADLLAALAPLPDDHARRKAYYWLGERNQTAAAADLLRAAANASALERVTAVNIVADFDDKVRAVWRTVRDVPNLAPHATFMLSNRWDPATADGDVVAFLAIEHALVALAHDGPAAAFYTLQEVGGLAAIEGGAHPEIEALTDAMTRASSHPGEAHASTR